MSGYVTVKLPRDLLREVDRLVGTFGFRSRTEVIKQAVREYIVSLKRLEPEVIRTKEVI